MSVKNPFLEANGKKSCIDHAAVISLDSLFALPDFRINERIMAIITTLRTITDKTLIVQSRSVHRQTLSHALAGDTTAFYQNEVAERKALDYPPFSTFIKITLAGKEASVRQEMSDLKHFLGNYPVRVFPAFTHLVRNQFIMHALLKLPKGMWSIRRATLPGEVTTSALHDDDTKSASDLLEKLRSLPPQFTIQVDPESVL